ncbi:MAG TPA: XRE family transcriptional regulator [Paludibacter sp.]|nr:XRE family transcriptional regulator [Paludibacter sp.]
MEKIGERIKRKRESKAMQLNDLAKKVGITSSALSQIERAKTYPSILTLKLIAQCLQTTVGELIGENEATLNDPVFRKEENVMICENESGAEMFLLSQHDLSKQVDPFLLRFQEKSNSTDLFKTVSGYLYAFMLSGEIQFELDSKSYVLQPGDSIYFNTKRNFRFENIFKGTSEILCVLPNNK